MIILMLDIVSITIMCAGNLQYKCGVFKAVKLPRNSSDGAVWCCTRQMSWHMSPRHNIDSTSRQFWQHAWSQRLGRCHVWFQGHPAVNIYYGFMVYSLQHFPLSVSPVWGQDTPLSPCPFTCSSFPPLLFPFFHWLYLFSSFVHPFPFYQNSPTPFPGRRS